MALHTLQTVAVAASPLGTNSPWGGAVVRPSVAARCRQLAPAVPAHTRPTWTARAELGRARLVTWVAERAARKGPANLGAERTGDMRAAHPTVTRALDGRTPRLLRAGTATQAASAMLTGTGGGSRAPWQAAPMCSRFRRSSSVWRSPRRLGGARRVKRRLSVQIPRVGSAP